MTSSVSIKTDMAKNVFFLLSLCPDHGNLAKTVQIYYICPIIAKLQQSGQNDKKKKHFVAMSVLIEKELAITERIFHR